MNTRFEKKMLRERALAARISLNPETRALFSRRICEHLLTLPELETAGTVMSYMAMRSEVDLAALHEALWACGKRLCFPVTRGKGIMEAVVCGPAGPWREGPFGIREPADGRIVPPEEIGLVLVPCVAFDGQGKRLGHGGGYYDRFLPGCSAARFVLTAFSCQKEDHLPTETWDVPADALATEEGLRILKDKKRS